MVTLSLGWCAGAGSPPPPTTRYSIQYLPSVPDNFVRPVAINDLGHIVGTISHFGATGQFLQGFLWTPQNGYQFLPFFPGSSGYAYPTSLNNSDQVVGYSNGGPGGPFFWSSSTGILELPAPLGSSTPGVATGIADDGLVAIDAQPRSYVWSKTKGAQFLPALAGQTNTSAAGVNRLGQIVGTSSSATSTTGVIWDHGQAPTIVGSAGDLLAFKLISSAGHTADGGVLYTPGEGFKELDRVVGSYSSPGILGVNASGYAVGHYEFEDLYRAFLYTPADGSLDLNGLVDFGQQPPPGFEDPHAILREATAINDAGAIVGVGDNGAFILTPVPEPSVLGVLLVVTVILLLTRRRAWKTVGVAGAMMVMAASASASAEYKPVIYSGAAAPGTEAGTGFLQFGLPTLSIDSNVAFQAALSGSAVDLINDGALYAGGAGSLKLLQRKGAPADPALGAGVKQFVFSNVGYDYAYELGPALAGGNVASYAYLQGPGIDFTNDTGIVAGPIGTPALVARYGDQAPGTPAGVHFTGFSLPAINAGGQLLLAGQIDGPNIRHENDPTRFSNDDGLWYASASGPLQLLARGGDPAPDVSGYNFTKPTNGLETIAMNASGQVALPLNLLNPLNSNDTRQALYAGSPGNFRKVIARGEAIPGIADQALRLSGALQPSINDAGQIAFFGNFSKPGLFSPDGLGVFLANPGAASPASDPYSFQFVARSGAAAPGAGGLIFNYFFRPLVDGSGGVVFNASLTTASSLNGEPAGAGIWAKTASGDLHLLLLDDTHVQGIPASDNISAATALAITSGGRILIHGNLTGPDITDGNDEVYYLADAGGILAPLLREGDLLDPGDGILRPAMKIDVFPNPLGSISNGISPFNESGQLAFRVTFADQSQGIFIASPDVGAIPEPGWGGLAMLVLTRGLMLRRRRVGERC